MNNFCKTVSQFLCCQYVVKFMTELLPLPLNFWKKRIFSVQIDLDFAHEKNSYYQLLMISMLILINIQLLKSQLTFQIFQKLLTKCGMRGYYSNLGTLKCQENLLSLLKSLLSNSFQQIELNGQCFSWSSVPAGVQHSSILGQLLFLYINDLPDNLQFAAKLFSNDTYHCFQMCMILLFQLVNQIVT